MTLLAFSLPVLAFFAVWDLIVGVANDAVNFLTPAVGSKAARPRVILAFAAAGVLAGTLFSSGMMEIARRGIFRPELLTMPELLAIFVGVMIADVLLLDLFNSYGLPTSTTVSVVFELLGGAVAVALFRIHASGQDWTALGHYINAGKAFAIVTGILLSVLLAFALSAAVMYLARLVFTFDLEPRLTRYGALFGGLAVAAIGHFILVKGISGTAFATPDLVALVKSRSDEVRFGLFLASAVLLQGYRLLGGNPLKPVVLFGTFALALAFAANDLVNFIGVPLAGFAAWSAAYATPDPLTVPMEALNAPAVSPPAILLAAGLVMLLTLIFSKKAKTVVRTSVELGRQQEWVVTYESNGLARIVVRMTCAFLDGAAKLVPRGIASRVEARFARPAHAGLSSPDAPAFDLLRAAVILSVASALISYGTAHKLPLSTTFVTFMAAMGASFADRAWGRDTAVFRVSGVFTVIGGWFATALFAFILCGAVTALLRASLLFLPVAVALAGFALWRSHARHAAREAEQGGLTRFRIPDGATPTAAASTVLAQTAHLLEAADATVDLALAAIPEHGLKRLRHARREVKKLERLRLLLSGNLLRAFGMAGDEARTALYFGQTAMLVHEVTDAARDLAHRCHIHVCNHHSALTDAQAAELAALRARLAGNGRLFAEMIGGAAFQRMAEAERAVQELEEMVRELNARQAHRTLQDEEGMRLATLFFTLLGDAVRLSRRRMKLARRLADAFGGASAAPAGTAKPA